LTEREVGYGDFEVFKSDRGFGFVSQTTAAMTYSCTSPRLKGLASSSARGDRGIIEKFSHKPVKLHFMSEEVKAAILEKSQNPFLMDYVVDGVVSTARANLHCTKSRRYTRRSVLLKRLGQTSQSGRSDQGVLRRCNRVQRLFAWFKEHRRRSRHLFVHERGQRTYDHGYPVGRR
jgi:hypothetical protein